MDDIHEQILSAFPGGGKPLMIKDIAQKCGLNRHTVARHLDALELLGRVRKVQIGNAKKYYPVTAIPVSGLIDLSSDLILIIDSSHKIQYINNSAEALLGLQNKPVIGERLELLNLDIFSSVQVLDGLKRFTPEKVFRTEILYEREENSVWYSLSIMAISTSPAASSIAIIAEDITRQKETELSNSFLAAIIGSTRDAIYSRDQTGRIKSWNQGAEELYGYRAEEVIGRDASFLIPPELSDEYEWITSTVCIGNPINSHETVRVHRKGEHIPVLLSVSPVKQADGTLLGCATISHDISEQKKYENKLKKAKDCAENLIRMSNILIISIDFTGKILSFNEIAEQITGYTADEVTGQNWFEIFTPKNLYPEVFDEFNRMIKGGSPESFENMILTRSGEERFILWHNNKVEQPDKSPHFVSFGVDITRLKKTEEELTEKNLILNAVFHSIGEQVYLIDSEGVIIAANQETAKKAGIPISEVIGRDVYELFPRTMGGPGREKVKEAAKTRSEIKFETFIDKRYISHHIQPLIMDGEHIGAVILAADISYLKGVEEQLRLHSEIIQNMKEGIILVRAEDNMIIYTNPRMDRMFGYEFGELVGEDVSILNAGIASDQVGKAEEIQEHLHLEGVWSGTLLNKKKDGTSFSCHAQVSTFIHSKYGQVWIGVHEDLSERSPDTSGSEISPGKE